MEAQVIAAVRRFAPLIVSYASLTQIPASIGAGLIAVESGGQVTARSPDNGPGLGRALGLMQVLEGNFAADQDPFNPTTNIAVGMGMLRSKMDAFGGRLDSGLAAYFGAVDEAGNPTDGTDLTGTTGKRYVELIHDAATNFLDLDTPLAAEVDDSFRSYAPHSGTWREAAINLKGIADDALETGRRIVADSAATWGAR